MHSCQCFQHFVRVWRLLSDTDVAALQFVYVAIESLAFSCVQHVLYVILFPTVSVMRILFSFYFIRFNSSVTGIMQDCIHSVQWILTGATSESAKQQHNGPLYVRMSINCIDLVILISLLTLCHCVSRHTHSLSNVHT